MKDVKHDHKATNKIKTTIFGIFLLLPLLFLIPTGLYYALNQNAQLSETTTIETNYYNTSTPLQEYNTENLQEHTVYNIDLIDTTGHAADSDLYFFEYLDLVSTYFEEYDTSTVDYYAIQINSADYVYIYTPTYEIAMAQEDFNMRPITLIMVIDDSLNISMDIKDFLDIWIPDCTIRGTNILIPSGTNTTTTTNNSITTSMINAWNDTWNNPLFSWSQNTPFTNSINSFVSWFSIGQNTYIASYLNYIVCMIGIYIVIDIIVVLFTCLTHLFSKEG